MAMIMAARKKQTAKADPEKNGGSAGEGSGRAVEPGRQHSPPSAQGGDVRLARSASRATSLSRADRDEMASLHRSASHNAVPIPPAYRHDHEWTMYEALADRDEVDLDDDERVRLQELHEQFDYAKHPDKIRAKQQKSAASITSTTSPTDPAQASRFKPVLPVSAETHEHDTTPAPSRRPSAEPAPHQPVAGNLSLGKPLP